MKIFHCLSHIALCEPRNFYIWFSFRRNSFIKMTGVDVDVEKEKKMLDNSAMASEILIVPSLGVTHKGSMPRRRKSLCDESSFGSSYDLQIKAIQRKGSMVNLHSHREPSPLPNSRKGMYSRIGLDRTQNLVVPSDPVGHINFNEHVRPDQNEARFFFLSSFQNLNDQL